MKFTTKNIFMLLMTFLFPFNLISCSTEKPDFNKYIFSDISECQDIDKLNYADSEITMLDSSDDKYLRGLTYVDFYGAEYKSRELEFKIFAYEFRSSEDSQKYFKNFTGAEQPSEKNFYASTGMRSYELVVIDCEKAYCVSTPKQCKNELLECLKSIFSVELDF